MIYNGKMDTILESWKMFLLVFFMYIGYYFINLLRISLKERISPVLLFKKVWPTFAVAITTASSAASFPQNTKDSVSKLGINKSLVEFGIPLGQVLFMPGILILLSCMELSFAESCGITITVPWLAMALITNIILSYAVPPVSGCMLTALSIAFTSLGIPIEMIGVALAIDAIIDFPCTAIDVSSWQLTMIDVADSLDMLDQEILHK